VFTPTELIFPSTPVGSTSALKTLTLTNEGNATMSAISYYYLGGATGVFIPESSTCFQTSNATLPPGASCTFQIAFKPAKAGTNSGELIIEAAKYPATGPEATVFYSGTGVD
jgi:hypothetical protein